MINKVIRTLKRMIRRVIIYSLEIQNFETSTFKFKGKNVGIKYNCSLLNTEKITLNDNVKLNFGVIIQPGLYEVVIGKNSLINQYSCIYGHTIIGENVMVAPHVMFAGGYHKNDDVNTPMIFQGDDSDGAIIIGNDVWIGANCVIQDNVKIGNGCIIGSGSIVTKDIPDYHIAIGNPAKIYKSRIKSDE